MRLKTLLIIILPILLCACGVYPDYKRPNAPETTAYTVGDDLVNEQQHIAIGEQLTTEWWSLFANENLNKVIKQALADNYSVATAKETLAQAAEAVNSKRGALMPQIGLNASVSNQLYGAAFFGPSTFTIPAFTYYELGPTVNWTIDLFGATRYAIEQQKALAAYQAHNLDAVYIMLTSNVAAQALEIASVKAEILRIKDMINDDEKVLTMVNTKFNVGSANRLDVLNARDRLESDKAMLPTLQQRLAAAQHALAILVGKAPADWEPPDFCLEDFVLPANIPASLPSQLVRKRPDILAAEATLHASHAAVGVATANLYPNISISGNLFQEALNLKNLFNGNSTAWAIAANLVQPLFTGGTLRAEKRKAEHAYKASLAQYKQTILLAFKQVADAITALANDAESVRAAQQAADIAYEALNLAYKSYDAGSTNLLQLQENQRTMENAELDLIKMQRQQYLDTVQLFVALGGSPIMHNKNANIEECTL